MIETIAIVGANVAGGQAALDLRTAGFDGRVLLIGTEPSLPYERPPLSKAVLAGATAPAATEIWPRTTFDAADIDVMTGTRVNRIDPARRRVELNSGEAITADRVLLATGARPRRLQTAGVSLAGVHELRTLTDAVKLRDDLVGGVRVVVIGAGFIGAEVAATARLLGCQVTLLEQAELPLLRTLGREVAQVYVRLHRAQGVQVHLGVGVTAILGDSRCRAVELDNGLVLPAEVVVCGVGVSPRVDLAEIAGLQVSDGIVVDDRCGTSIPEVFAAGDVARRPSSYASGSIRPESWQSAQRQGAHAARCMLGGTESFDDLPWFWSDQYDVKLQVAGFPTLADEMLWRGDPDSGHAVALYLSQGVVCAAVGLNRPREVRAAMELIRSRVHVTDRGALADASVDLRSLQPSTPTHDLPSKS
ncbi:MAG: NAD(P)/FAD-dependent oxidoreductase [Acidimicrobiia bacterium]